MRRASAIEKESGQIETVKDLTDVFESIASNQVAKVKNKVTLSQEFFALLWKRYTSIRIDPRQRITNRGVGDNDRSVYIMVSAEAGLSGLLLLSKSITAETKIESFSGSWSLAKTFSTVALSVSSKV